MGCARLSASHARLCVTGRRGCPPGQCGCHYVRALRVTRFGRRYMVVRVVRLAMRDATREDESAEPRVQRSKQERTSGDVAEPTARGGGERSASPFVIDSGAGSPQSFSLFTGMKNVACGLFAVWAVTAATPVIAANPPTYQNINSLLILRILYVLGLQRLPPLSTEPNRCERAFVGNTIGQANGVYDKPIDLRFCDYTNEKSNLKGKSLAAALMSDAKFDGADMTEVVMSKAYAVGASFKGVDFSNAVLDRVNFAKANLQGASFKNTVLSGSTFDDAQLEDVIFEDTIIGYIDLQKLCTNTTINAEGRAELGCR
ncbi:hypothetical protein Scep_025379 [Stephania cephalantha]|uniref:Thylakoid lumenal 17.4 kDa protein, chloroplastic n=1 Tax=Stephania cephalantha TaxID=152367 RepID=A0AAP0EI42_9MAGN